MAINVNTVYQTVLLILNKEQRGYITPSEFNSLGTQVQLEIFEKYFEDMNQQIRVPQTDTDYADRVKNLDEKLAIFKTFGDAAFTSITPSSTGKTLSYWTLPGLDAYGQEVIFYRLGTVLYKNQTEIQRVDRAEFYQVNKSLLTKPSTTFPIYLFENFKLYVKPDTIVTAGDIQVEYVRKPISPIWGFTVGTLGQYLYNSNPYDANTMPTGSIDFDLHISEQTNLILQILKYAGVIIRDPQIVQDAAQQVAINEQNEKI